MDTDRNLLFGVLALQADLITNDQFAKACALWGAEKDRPLGEILVETEWLTPADRDDVERLLRRKLQKHGGDARAQLPDPGVGESGSQDAFADLRTSRQFRGRT